MNRFFKISQICVLSALTLSGCATIFTGTTQTINLQAIDENNAPLRDVVCSVSDGKGMVYPVNSNPGSFLVNKGNGSLNPSCKKDGYFQKSFGVGESFSGTTLVNILFWPGFIVDAATGSMHKYPSHITVIMEKESKK